ncbi:MAG: enoyl-CoA hydratase/isomerase family protein, partial [Deltaproteobacteria bacterium]|nr:enoyl-CoA hydratase/isomerase family protein [Deltaproteobacteria bacterium]
MELPSTILYEKKGRVAIVTFNRPDARNAFTLEMLEGMNAAF